MVGRTCGVCLGVLALALALSPAPTAWGQDRADKVFQHWKTFTATTEPPVYVCYTPDAQDNLVTLQLGRFANRCGSTRMLITVGAETTNAKDWKQDKLQGEMRVDQQPVRKIVANGSFRAGEKGGVYEVHTFENPAGVLPEMSRGETVRLRLTAGGQEFYFRFPLQGFAPAFERITQMCAQGGGGQAKGGQPRSGGAPKPPGPKSDSEFFDKPAPPKPEGKAPKTDKDFF